MADEWIRWRISLYTSPKVTAMCHALESSPLVRDVLSVTRDASRVTNAPSRGVTRVTRCLVLNALSRVWSAANTHTRDGVFVNTALDYLDELADFDGFGAAMAGVGWAIYDDQAHTVTLPNFNEYNTPAKKRDPTHADRQRRYRERKKAAEEGLTRDTVTVTSRDTVTRDVDKRREDLSLKTKSYTSLAGATDPAKVDRQSANVQGSKTNGHAPSMTVDAVVELWHDVMPELPRVRKLTSARRAVIAARIREDLHDDESWRDFFGYIRTRPFLMGQVPPTPQHPRPFRPSLLWFCKAENYAKCLEGAYQ